MTTPDQVRSRVALVTRTSSGIGEATALRLGELGFTVYGAARRVDRMQALADQGVRILAMDVTDENSVAAGVQQILDKTGRIDVLSTTPATAPTAQWRTYR